MFNVKNDTGRYFFKISLSKPVFFKSGRMRTVLSDLGIIGSRNDILTIALIQLCIPSEARYVKNLAHSLITFHISASVASIKVFSGPPEKQFVTEPPVCVPVNPNSLLMFNILL